jgi:hypothetical protein
MFFQAEPLANERVFWPLKIPRVSLEGGRQGQLIKEVDRIGEL